MTLSNYRRFTIPIIILVIILLLGFFAIIIFSQKPQSSKNLQASPNIVPFTGNKIPQQAGSETDLAKIRQFLPIHQSEYSIEYLEAINLINVKIPANTKEGYLSAKTKVIDYLKSKGVQDYCKLNIIWVALDPKVNKSLTTQDLKPTSCRKTFP